jgi:carboxymethylenebutenolidase
MPSGCATARLPDEHGAGRPAQYSDFALVRGTFMSARAFSRREFVSAVSLGVGASWLTGFSQASNRSGSMQVAWGSAVTAPGIVRSNVSFKSGIDDVPALLAYPRARGRYPAVLVIHSSWLVEPYVAETVAMLAQAGFVGLAVDLFHFFPKVSSWEEARRAQGPEIAKLIETEFREPRMVRNLQSGIVYLRTQPFTETGGVGVMGFCGGGWNALLFGAQSNDVGAVVAYYAPVDSSNIQHRAPLALASYLRVPVQYHGVRADPNAPPADVDRLQAILAAQGTPFERHTYDSEHGFFGYDRNGIFDPTAAALSWRRTVDFLRRHVGRKTPARRLAPAAPADLHERGPSSAVGDHVMFHGH